MLRTLLVVSTLFLVAAAPDPAAPSFCTRLAPKLKMKPVSGGNAASSTPQGWKVNMLGGLGPALFGGSAMATFSVEPADNDESLDYSRFQNACKTNTKGISCTVNGPAELHVGTKNGEVVEEIRSGEQETVEMRGATIHCRDGQPTSAT